MNLGLTWRLLRGAGRRGLLGTWLTLGAVAVSTALLLFAVAVNFAFDARAERGAWRNPVPATAGAVAIEASRYDYVRDQAITVVDLAALGRDAPAPPGMPRFPQPGEVWLSPALAALAERLPAGELAKRYPEPKGVLGDEALVHPDELVAVVGHGPDAPEVTASRADDWVVAKPPTKVATLAGATSEDAEAYRMLSLVASVLMAVPLLVFGGAAARLTVARRDQRLAALRLIGATPGQVVGMTVAEAVIVALAGALAGAVVFAVAAPLLAGVEIQGGPWFVSDLFPDPLVLAGVLVAVPLLVGLSAVAGLRRVVVSPLGVAKRQTPPALRFVRVLVLLAALAVVVTALGSDADAATMDRARTALAGLVPGRTPTTEADDQRFGSQILADIRVGTVVVLSASFLVAIASAGITAASSILDRRQTYGLLRLAGTPLEVLDQARRAETLIPLTVMGGGAILAGVFCAVPFMIGGVSTVGVITLVGCVVAGFAGVIGAGALSRPLLRTVTEDPAPRPD
ncbi:FtsX-like permease family protein [Nonomuraea sp. NPDC002799]